MKLPMKCDIDLPRDGLSVIEEVEAFLPSILILHVRHLYKSQICRNLTQPLKKMIPSLNQLVLHQCRRTNIKLCMAYSLLDSFLPLSNNYHVG